MLAEASGEFHTFTVKQKGFILLGVPCLVNAALVGALLLSASDYRRAIDSYVANLRVAIAISSNQADLTKFVFEAMRIDENERATADYKAKHSRMIDELNRLERLYEQWDKLDPAFSKVVSTAREFTRTGREFTDEAKAMSEAQQFDEIDDNIFLRRYMLRLYQTFQSFMSETAAINEKIFSRSDSVAAKAKNSVTILQLALGANVLLLVVSVYLVSKGWSRRLDAVSKSASRIAQKQLVSESVPGRDEIADIEKALIAGSNSISDMKQREVQIWEQSESVLLALDKDFRVCSASPNIHNFFSKRDGGESSVPSSEGVVGSSFLSWLDDRIVSETLRANPSSYLDQNVVWSILGKNCSIAFKSLAAVVSETKSDDAASSSGGAIYSVSAHDVDEETRLAKMRALLVSMISHDIRIPLGSVRNSIQMRSAANDLPPEIQRELDACESECNLIIETVTSLLDVDKVDKDRSSILREFVSLLDVVEETCEPLVGTKGGIRLSFKDIGVIGDSAQFVRLLNLLFHALRSVFSEQTIEVAAKTSGTFVYLHVSVDARPAPSPEPSGPPIETVYASDSRVKLAMAIADRYDVAISTTSSDGCFSVRVRFIAYEEDRDSSLGQGNEDQPT